MKRLLILFSALLIAFMGVWVFKSKTPANRPGDHSVADNNVPWWEVEGAKPVADSQWILDPEIPDNYIPVPGEDELYMVVDDDGKITQYRHRTKQDDGSWKWEDTNPDIPDNYEAVDGLENIYKVTNSDGSVSYYKYIRNDDDTFAFIPVDENGNELKLESDGSETIPSNYIHISGNVYAVYNEHGVLIGYKERKVDKDGKYYWIDTKKPEEKKTENTGGNNGGNNQGGIPPVDIGNTSGNNSGGGNGQGGGGNSGEVIYSQDGTYTQTETIISNETTGGWVITYQTIVTRVFDSKGVLLSTKKEGPTEISRVNTGSTGGGNTPDPSKIASSLSGEYARVSVGLSYDNNMANSVIAKINAERVAAGKSSLSVSNSSDTYKIAGTRAADMAIYDHADYDSPMYGTLDEMCNRFNVTAAAPTEIVWKTTSGKSADAIASRLQVMSNGLLSSGSFSSVGLSIVAKGGYYYINMILFG